MADGRRHSGAECERRPTLTVDAGFVDGAATTAALIELFAKAPSFSQRVDRPLLDRLLRVAHDWDEHPAAPDLGATLVHGDFNSRNVPVHRNAGSWSVAKRNNASRAALTVCLYEC